MDVSFLWVLTFFLLGLAIVHFFIKSDELPTLLVLFFMFTGLMRYDAVLAGKADWVVVNYALDIFQLNDVLALVALNYFFIGTAVLTLVYMCLVYIIPARRKVHDTQKGFEHYVYIHRMKILGGFYVFLILNFFSKGAISGSVAMGNSYFYLFGMADGGFILLLFNYFRMIPKWLPYRKIYVGFLIYLAITLSYNPTTRFQFMSWVVALGIFLFRHYTPWQKLKYYVIGGFGLLVVFAMAGVSRNTNLDNLSWGQRVELSMQRNDERTDQNMLDGFMMVLNVYPEHLNFRYGQEHLEILYRPIPRQLWPGKPLGGYANKLGLNDVDKGTIGISQTIYGSFYEEGGVAGIIILCIIYAFLLVSILRFTERFNSDIRWLLKGILMASVIPLLRGGDLPGIYAFIGMSFWPVFIFIYFYYRRVRLQRKLLVISPPQVEEV